MKDKLIDLVESNNNKAYQVLLELEMTCTNSSELYDYFDYLLDLLKSDKLFIKIRGFRLICSLAKWDEDNKINKNIDEILKTLDDKTGVCIRQCLLKINLILLYKPELTDKIENKLKSVDLSIYKESMQSLIERDIKKILDNI